MQQGVYERAREIHDDTQNIREETRATRDVTKIICEDTRNILVRNFVA